MPTKPTPAVHSDTQHPGGSEVAKPVNDRSQLLPADRLQMIADLVSERGSVRGSDLVEMLGVTDETIRRDLLRLSEMGVVRRSRGGAVAARTPDEAGTAQRLREHASEKLAIGRTAAELVADGSSVILDSGTTTLALARALRGPPQPHRGHHRGHQCRGAGRQPGHDRGHDRRRHPTPDVRCQRRADRGDPAGDPRRPGLPGHAQRLGQGRPDLPQLRGGGRQTGHDRGRHGGHPARGCAPSSDEHRWCASPTSTRCTRSSPPPAWTPRRPMPSGTWASSSSSPSRHRRPARPGSRRGLIGPTASVQFGTIVGQYSGSTRPAITSAWMCSTSGRSRTAVVACSTSESAALPTSTARVLRSPTCAATAGDRGRSRRPVGPVDQHLVGGPHRGVTAAVGQHPGDMRRHRRQHRDTVTAELQGGQQLLIGRVSVDQHPERLGGQRTLACRTPGGPCCRSSATA